LLIVVSAAGLVSMHHLLVHTEHTMPMTMASATHTGHTGPDPAGVNSVEARSTSVASQPDCCDPMDMVGHFCLAVLTAVAAFAAALIVAVARRRPLEPGHLLAAVSAVAARAPPIGCARLTQLCVLRR
jgi:hypothetical protein